MPPVVTVENLTKQYGALTAVDSLSFEIQEGEIFGMVGPNGAGKTTTIEMIEGLRRADRGQVRVLGLDPERERARLALQMGAQLQQASLPPRLRASEALELFASFYPNPESPTSLLERLGLAEHARTPVSKLSGGQRQRLFIALALLNRPRLVFFDELTTGLDPQARRAMWELVRQIRAGGATVFLTTHFMEEAERLCDRVMILDHGRCVALDTPEALVNQLGVEKRLVFNLPEGQSLPELDGLPGVTHLENSAERVILYGQGRRFTSQVIAALEDRGVELLDLRTEQANLEDVFLRLTGREMRD